jgi:hypothetical protein
MTEDGLSDGRTQPTSGRSSLGTQPVGWVERSETHQIRSGKRMGFARAQPILRAQPIPPRSSPGVVSWLARRTGRQTSGAARWATGRRAIAGGDGATCITGGDGAPRIIGRRIGIAGATMRGRGRCRQRGAENDCGGQRDCCPARHCRISGLSCRGLAPSGPAAAALSCLVEKWGWRAMTPSASGWVMQGKAHQIPASGMWISQGLNPPYRTARIRENSSLRAKRSNPVRP